MFNLDLESCLFCQIADSCAVNTSVAQQLSIPNVGCAGHLHNLETEAMVLSDQKLRACIDSVHKTMAYCRSRLRNRAILRNITTLVLVFENKTRCSGKFLMPQRFE